MELFGLNSNLNGLLEFWSIKASLVDFLVNFLVDSVMSFYILPIPTKILKFS